MKRIILLLGWLVGFGVFLAPAFAGEIQGRIFITRTLTKKRVNPPVYQLRGISLPAVKEEPQSIDELSRTAVYLEGPLAFAPAPAEVTLTQKNQRFDPELLIVPVGSTVSFPNADPIFHNVFSLSKAAQFDLGFYPAGHTRTVKLDKPGIVQVYCHLHPNMTAAIVVVPNGRYAKPRADGTFAFSGLAAGTYSVVVWHKSAGFFRAAIPVAETGTATLSLAIPLAEGN